jgi:hypothetical protein
MTDTGAAGQDGGDSHDIFGPLERSGAVRGWLLVAVVFVIGALVLPSATRPGLGTAPASATSPTVPVSTVPSSSSPAPAASSSTTSPTTTTTVAVPTVAPSTIKVLVANGTNTSGVASAVSSLLSGKGYSTLTPVNALTVVSASQVYAIGPAAAGAARQVAAALGLPQTSVEPASQPVPVASPGAATVVVIVGPDLASRA